AQAQASSFTTSSSEAVFIRHRRRPRIVARKLPTSVGSDSRKAARNAGGWRFRDRLPEALWTCAVVYNRFLIFPCVHMVPRCGGITFRRGLPPPGSIFMSGNSLGQFFRVTNFGESHGPAIGAVVDGCPPGLALTREDIQKELDRR